MVQQALSNRPESMINGSQRRQPAAAKQPNSAVKPLLQVPAPASPKQLAPGKFVLVDGLNMIRLPGSAPRLENLLAVTLDLARRGIDFGCVCDANTFFVLREAGGLAEAETYKYLLCNFGDFFVEVTGGTRADDVILLEADDREARVISNDRFAPYEIEYPWVKNPQRILRVNRFRANLHIDGRRLSIRASLNDMVRELENLLADFPY
jgi:hypothetical protein